MNDVDEIKLTSSIAAAYERLPAPELARLKTVEDRLMRALPRAAAHRPAMPWYGWLALGLVTTAAAGWWASEFFSAEATKQDSAPPVVIEQLDAKPQSGDKDATDKSRNESRNSPTIYRREAY
jgi:hypothetical protein